MFSKFQQIPTQRGGKCTSPGRRTRWKLALRAKIAKHEIELSRGEVKVLLRRGKGDRGERGNSLPGGKHRPVRNVFHVPTSVYDVDEQPVVRKEDNTGTTNFARLHQGFSRLFSSPTMHAEVSM